MEKQEGSRSMRIPRCRLEDNIKMDLREIIRGGMGWIDLPKDRDQWRVLINMTMNFQVPRNVGKFLSSCTTGGFRRRGNHHGDNQLLSR
jgi:hypothetical protein